MRTTTQFEANTSTETVSRWLAGAVTLLVAAVSAAGLWTTGLYEDGAAVEAMFRGYDLVTLAVVAPLLALTLVPTLRDSTSAVLLRVSLLAFCVYNYAYYLFGAELNTALLAHIGVVALSVYALVLTLATMDVEALPARFRARTPVRTVAILLGLLGVALAALQISGLAAFALSGTPLREPSQLVVPATFTRLGAVLDLALLAPVYILAAVLLWRRRPWGYVLASAALIAGLLHQVSYLAGMAFQMNAEVPGSSFDPFEPVIITVYLVAAGLLLANLRPDRGTQPPIAATPGLASHMR